MPKSIDEETLEILLSFVAEGYERLDDAEAQLAHLEEGETESRLHSIFRLFHSVKGSAGYLGLNNIQKLTHEAETLLDVFLKEKKPLAQDAVDVIYETVDILRTLITLVEKEFCDDDGEQKAGEQTEKIKAQISLIRGGAAAAPANPGNASSPSASPASEKQEGAAAEHSHKSDSPKEEPLPANEILLGDLVTADMVQRFIGECADLLDKGESILLSLDPKENNTDKIHEIFRAVHTIKGNAGFFGYALMERLCMEFETLLDDARKTPGALGEARINASIKTVDYLRELLSGLQVVSTAQPAQRPDASSEQDAAPQKKPSLPEYKPLGEILVGMGAADRNAIQEALDEQERSLGEILVQKGIVPPEKVDEALKLQGESLKKNQSDTAGEIVRKEIRVDTNKLDKLFELVGELITAESMVMNNADLAGLAQDSFTKAFSRLNKISREIQETTMMIRMIPLDGLFQKMARLVRDLSRKMDRPIKLAVSGQDTEMDKNVIEQISDPLVHILRNAIDHGIEPKDKRIASGKDETGSIKLNAKYEGSEIWISVQDDGAGLDRDKILAKAIERGLLKGDPASFKDQDIFSCIFEPGFSTAAIVSDVSGRGVGMDVVKRNLDKIRGRIDIKTTPGAGTEFILAIPLTMAIIDGITVRAGANRYSLPLAEILEFVKIQDSQISRTGTGEETVNIRNDFLPLIRLHEVFNIEGAVTEPADGILIVMQNNGRRACLLIDEVIGNQQIVVKSLSEYLGKVDGISGCSILGDGGVSFIIDTGKLMSLRLE
ncbi:MAG: chemotaxis protein CheA [Spirochaetales bacterium]|nr:chemotaxis protein CheA [Spirochaetales bacterium]